jgi:ATP-dependent DNA helicase RecG
MASSLQTLVKILKLEQGKGYQNRAVIGGFARFSFHWAREAHGQARSQANHDLVDDIAARLRAYENTAEDERPALIEAIIALATGEVESQEAQEFSPPPPAPPLAPEAAAAPPTTPTETTQAGDEPTELEEESADDWFMQPAATPAAEPIAAPRSVRERRGYAWQQHHEATPDSLRGLDAPATTLRGVGETRSEQLERLGVHTVRDLLFLFPRRYDDYSRMKAINQLVPGEEVTIIGVVERVAAIPMKNGGKRVEAYLNDGSATLRLNWFNQPWMEQQLTQGESIVASGKIEQYLGRLLINSPEIEPLDSDSLHTGRIVPVYPLTKGLGPRVMRNMMKDVADAWAPYLPDPLPLEMRESADLMDYGDAVGQMHFPDSWEDKEAAQHRLAFDELFLLHLAMLQQRHTWQQRQGTPLAVDDGWVAGFEATLPYTLTGAQQRALAEIRQDMAQGIPMNRLLQGDVGSGKTVVAAIAIGIAVQNNVQAAIMAPTSILAEQHYASLCSLLGNSPVAEQAHVSLLTGHSSDSERSAIYAGLASGEVNVVVGTQALIQEGVAFQHLGLAVIDEQHRFGVAQRGTLREKAAGGNPHLLVMTATPIPRTLALTLHADLDLSIMDEMPPGRQPVETRVLQPKERERAYSFIRGQAEQGRQAFVIYPLVEESDKTEAASAVEGYERLQKTVFPDLRLGLVHGRMRPDEKDAAMEAFYRGETQVLVATSVIEVGIDVPNATVMMVENASRFGLAQLHQLRGRVGRGGHTGYCLLMSDTPFMDRDERLTAVEQTNDGFKLAEIDWEMRGAGDLLGTRQSGFGVSRFANWMDPRLVGEVQHQARPVFERDPELKAPAHEMLAQRVQAVIQEKESGDIS